MKKGWRGLVTGILGVSLLFGSLGTASVSAAPVPKDIKGHWAQSQLQDWLNKGYLGGYQDGTVRPNKPITRAEFVALINRLFGYNQTAAITFKDLKSTNWYYTEVAKAVAAGYIGGYENKTFRPNNPITRQEAAVIAAKVLKLNTSSTTLSFKDAKQIPAWSRGAVAAAAAKKIINGYPNGTFGPKRALTRAEAVGIIANAVVHKPSQGGTLPTPTPTPSASPSPSPSATPAPTATVPPVSGGGSGGGGGGTGGGGGGGGGGISAPTVTNLTYGQVGTVTADVYLTPSVTGDVYYVAVPYTSNIAWPSALQIRDGKDAAGQNAVNSGHVKATGTTNVSFPVYGLTANTEYAVFAAMTDSTGGNWSSVQMLRLKTQPAVAGGITAIRPGTIGTPGPNGTVTADVYVTYGSAATTDHLHYVVLPASEGAPSASQVLNAQNSSGQTVAAPLSGNKAEPVGTEATHLALAGLNANTEYKLYLVTSTGSNNPSPVEVFRFRTR